MPAIFRKKQFWGTLIAVLLLAFCVKDISATQVQLLYQRLNFYYLIPSVAMAFLMIILKAIRWRTIVEKTKKLSLVRAISLFSAGQVLNISMPALTGQVGRLLLFSRRENLSKTYVFSTIVLEVLFDSITMLIFIFLLSTASFVFPKEYRSISIIIGIATALLFLILYLILHYKVRIEAAGRKVLRGRWPGVYVKLKKFSNSFTKGLALLRSSQYFLKTFFLSLGAWAAHALVIYFLFKSSGFELPIISAVVVMVINTIALMVPITPGNAGTFELAVVAALLAYKITKSDAVLFAIALHIIDIIPIFVMGLFFFRTERVSIKEIKKIKEEGEKEEIPVDVDDVITEEHKL